MDSLVIALVNQKILRPTDFTYPNAEGGGYLESGARRVFLKYFYDIADDRRRDRLATLLEGQGRRVQDSVFECFLSLQEMKTLHRQVQRQVNPAEDNVRFYWIAADALPRTLTIGSPPPQPPPTVYII